MGPRIREDTEGEGGMGMGPRIREDKRGWGDWVKRGVCFP